MHPATGYESLRVRQSGPIAPVVTIGAVAWTHVGQPTSCEPMHRLIPCLLATFVLGACAAPSASVPAPRAGGGADSAPVLALGPEATEAPLQAALPIRPVSRTRTAKPLPSSTDSPATEISVLGDPYPEPSTVKPTRTPKPPRATATARPAGASGGGGSGGGSSGGSGSGSSSGGSNSPTKTRAPSRTPKPSLPTETRAPTEDRRPITLLRRGGLVIYQRHGSTDWDQDPREREWVLEVLASGDDDLFEDCDRQRLLTDAGRDEARGIGEAVRALGIPIGEVLTSPWCRTRETADLAYGGGEVAHGRLFDTGYLKTGSDERKEYRDKLRELLSNGPGEGANRVIVGHMPQLLDAAGVSLSEGEAAIIQPGDGDFKVLTRVRAGDWARLDR